MMSAGARGASAISEEQEPPRNLVVAAPHAARRSRVATRRSGATDDVALPAAEPFHKRPCWCHLSSQPANRLRHAKRRAASQRARRPAGVRPSIGGQHVHRCGGRPQKRGAHAGLHAQRPHAVRSVAGPAPPRHMRLRFVSASELLLKFIFIHDHTQTAQAGVGAHCWQQHVVRERLRQLIAVAGQRAQMRVGRQRLEQRAQAVFAQLT
jgi:hypothetical protein